MLSALRLAARNPAACARCARAVAGSDAVPRTARTGVASPPPHLWHRSFAARAAFDSSAPTLRSLLDRVPADAEGSEHAASLKGIAAGVDASGAQSLLSDLRAMRDLGEALHPRALGVVLEACSAGALGREAAALLLDEGGAAAGGDEVLSTRHYNAALEACRRGGCAEEAEALVRAMQEAGVPRNRATYVSAIGSCGRRGAWDAAERLLQEMREDEGAGANKAAYHRALHSCAVALQPARAAALVEAMRGDGVAPSAHSYVFALEACVRAGDADAALALWADLQ
eukprot:g7505.t1